MHAFLRYLFRQKTGNAIRALGRMAILSAHNRRSPTAIEEASPVLEQEFDIAEGQCPDDEIVSDRALIADEDARRVEEKADETESPNDLRATEGNSEMQKTVIVESVAEGNSHQEAQTADVCTDFGGELEKIDSTTDEVSPTGEESGSSNRPRRIDTEKETPESTSESSPETRNDALRNVTAQLEISISRKSEKVVERSSEVEERAIPGSQASRRIFRGDSRDSGIGDCGSSRLTSPMQVDELTMVSTIEEEATIGREGDGALKEDEEVLKDRLDSTGISTSLARGKEVARRDTKCTTKDANKVATKGAVTKASCDTNTERKGVCADAFARGKKIYFCCRSEILVVSSIARARAPSGNEKIFPSRP